VLHSIVSTPYCCRLLRNCRCGRAERKQTGFYVVDVSGLMAQWMLDYILLAVDSVVQDEEHGCRGGPILCILLRSVRGYSRPDHC
jgi:hypothetical protein